MPNANTPHKPGAGSTGPKSVAGRETSSRNATKHGARSEKHIILPSESLTDYAELCERWHDEYPPSSDLEIEFLDRLTERDWHFQRCDRLYNEAFMKALTENPDPAFWPEEVHKHIDRMQRYRAVAERAWRSAQKDLIALRKNRIAEIRLLEQTRRIRFHNYRDKIVKSPQPENVIQENQTQKYEKPAQRGPAGDDERSPNRVR